ncbi:fatty acid 2-hydroxylase-like [Ylistrum balloti]|uniref:fatty acid 2-hydroxylase-like n=1 Tax=Ylistrum balloti TaxID=509963 RepID=UPI002905BDC6|nr:fatty acid 2-hydroxylase-like [Ylistrum balloti]
MRCYSDLEVKELVKQEKVIVINNDKVYDVTDFVERHPGGKHYLLDHVGEDVTNLMSKESPHQHTQAAMTILKKYCLGHYKYYQGKNGLRHREINGNEKNGIVRNENLKKDGTESHHEHYSDLEKLVDWDKPMLTQVAHLGERYFEWVHYPEDKHIRLFKSDFCEYFSQCPWYVVPMYWVPMLILFLYSSFRLLSEAPCIFPGTSYEMTPKHMPLMFMIGLISWTLDEYVIHRWMFHLRPPSNSRLLVTLHFLLHGQHHKTPLDKKRLVFPPVPATILGITLYSIYATVFPHGITLSFAAGTVTGYIIYDLTHYFLHHGRPTMPYFISLKKYHVKHHFENQQLGFGISSKFWDYPFGTLIPEC